MQFLILLGDLFSSLSFQLSPADTLTVSLEAQTVCIDKSGQKESFEINSYKKTCLLHGYDDIDYLINMRTAIEQFEQKVA